MSGSKKVDIFVTFEGVDPEVAADLMADLTEWYKEDPFDFSVTTHTEEPSDNTEGPDEGETEEDPNVHELYFEECCSATADNSLKAGAYPQRNRVDFETEALERTAQTYYERGFDAGHAYAKEEGETEIVSVIDPSVKFKIPPLRLVRHPRG